LCHLQGVDPQVLTQVSDPVPQHLVLPGQHLGLGLVECALVPAAQRKMLATVLADRRGSQSRRRTTTGCPRSVSQVIARDIEGAARDSGRSRHGARGGDV
jgi:hypothetical protein